MHRHVDVRGKDRHEQRYEPPAGEGPRRERDETEASEDLRDTRNVDQQSDATATLRAVPSLNEPSLPSRPDTVWWPGERPIQASTCLTWWASAEARPGAEPRPNSRESPPRPASWRDEG